MENNFDDEFKEAIEWKLVLPKSDVLSFRFSIFQDENRQGHRESDVFMSNELLGILQDTFYVTHFGSSHYEHISPYSKDGLDERDDYWDIFRWIWHNFTAILRNNIKEINVFRSSDESAALSKKKGNAYKLFVREMGQPFITRYDLYLFSLLFWSKNYIRKHFGSCTDIICDHRKFVRFWNGVVSFLSESVLKLQQDVVGKLQSKFENILKGPDRNAEYATFHNTYLREKGGCFSLTMVDKKDGSKQDVLCFSGLKDSSQDPTIYKAIQKIKDEGGFQDPHVVQVTDKIRYDLICGLYITYGEAKKCNIFSKKGRYNRMFTCCERKTFADYDWNDCASYTMIVKYAPCELCEMSVRKHKTLYNGHVLHGKATQPLKRIGEFDRLAMCMCSKFCRINMHHPHLCDHCGYTAK